MARKNLVELDMGSQKVSNVLNPTADQDAATKKYVDEVGKPIQLYNGRPYRMINSTTSSYVSRYAKPAGVQVAITKLIVSNTTITTSYKFYSAIVESPNTFRATIGSELLIPARSRLVVDCFVPLNDNEYIACGQVESASSALTTYIDVEFQGVVFS